MARETHYIQRPPPEPLRGTLEKRLDMPHDGQVERGRERTELARDRGVRALWATAVAYFAGTKNNGHK